MNILQSFFISLVVLIHIYIVILEMFLWTSKKGIKAFALKSKSFAEDTKVLAANQGLYNGFLVAGCIWSYSIASHQNLMFFLLCISVAGLYGAYSTKSIKILYIQTLPALLAILSLLFL